MEIRKRQTDSGSTVVELEGMLVLGRESQQLEHTIEKLVEEGNKKIIVDLAKVSHIDSSGIGVLVGSFGHCKRSGGAMRLTGVREPLSRIMKITGVDQVLPLDSSLEEAELKFGAD
jgi:anti-sigma B factor antagonist